MERQKSRQKRKITPFNILALTPGDAVFFVPPRTTHPRYGQRATVVRAARQDVQSPSVRLQFSDGKQQTVKADQVRRVAPPAVDPAYLQEARRLPSWSRLVAQVREAQQQEPDSPQAAAHAQAAEQRARQMAGMLRAIIPAEVQPQAPQLLLNAARVEAEQQQQRQAQRSGRGPVRHQLPAPVTTLVDSAQLDQEARALINLIAKSIHRRYFLSDKQIEQRRSDEDREKARIHGVLRQIISLGQQEVGAADIKDHSSGKGSELHGQLQDHLTAAYQKGLEVCQMLSAGRVEAAQVLAAQVQGHRAAYLVANAELEKHRRKHHTGRYFHGDILSVRVEHVLTGENGEFLGYEGMTQYYARVVFIWDEDGVTLTVANAAELEAVTGVHIGAAGWAALCRWVQDMSERAGGRKQGRRQDDDDHLIYRDDRGYLVARKGTPQELVLALDCIRRALVVGMAGQGIWGSELPEGAPGEGRHLVVFTKS